MYMAIICPKSCRFCGTFSMHVVHVKWSIKKPIAEVETFLTSMDVAHGCDVIRGAKCGMIILELNKSEMLPPPL